MSDEIVNKVAQSGLINIDLEDYYPNFDIVEFDLKPFLFQELVLREKDFRAQLKEHDWGQYKGKGVVVLCSVDAIIQPWAYLLVATYLNPVAQFVSADSKHNLIEEFYHQMIQSLDASEFKDGRVIIKGCSKREVPQSAYISLVSKLQPVVKSLMYGEACSTVPLVKKKA